MRLPEAVELLRLHREEWDDGTLEDLAVFGSVARGAASPESDVDFLLAFDRPVGLLHLVKFKLAFEEILRRRVDVVTPGGLKVALREEVLEDAVRVDDPRDARDVGPRRKRWRWRVGEMLTAIERIRRYTQGLTPETFRENELVQDAVLRNLLTLGEVVGYLPEEIRVLHRDVPWERLRQVRHLVAHDYFGIDPALVWVTVTQELPPLVPPLERIAQKNPPRVAGTGT